jgi:PAS domain S-box-containing protein
MNTIDPAALRLAAIVESSDDAIVSHDLNGTVETWNRAAARIFGYNADEMLGRPVSLLVPPERRADEAALVNHVRQGASVTQLETSALTKRGEHIPILLSASPVRGSDGDIIGIARIIRDLSLQQRTERDALRLASIVNSSDDAIVSKDLNGVVQTWNAAAERMFGYSAAEMIGQSIMKIIPPDRYSEEELVLSRIRRGDPVEPFETMRQREDGRLIDVWLSVSPIRTPSGLIIGASKIVRDVTLPRRLAREAEEAIRVKDEFLATLSHELRTPLNAVLGYTRMLQSGKLGADRQERAIDVIERNASLLHQLVSDVLDVSGIVTGRMRLTPVACDLTAVVRAACDVVLPMSEAKGVPLHVDPPASPIVIRCDLERMQQVFWNLLTNALKFTPPGGQVFVTIGVRDQLAAVTVADTGIGIKRESLPRVFERFWQADSVYSRYTGGIGLGLALARHFVELHGGTISASSAGAGQGSTFTVLLPLQPA